MITTIILLSYLGPIILYLFILWLYLPKNSTLSDLTEFLHDNDDRFAPPFLMVMPVFNIIGLLATIMVAIIEFISSYIKKHGDLRIK